MSDHRYNPEKTLRAGYVQELQATIAQQKAEIKRYHEALEYTKEHLDGPTQRFADSLADGRTERCPVCGVPTIKQSLVACCDFHGCVCEDCWDYCEHVFTKDKP